jgi:tetratricopeptide (TPR) repeat protein
MSEVLLSACLIVRNEEKYLPSCLASLVGLADELVIVDSGSTDGTIHIARDHGALLIFHTWRNDYSAARNAGLERASGRFILYIDADEEVWPEDAHALKEAIASDHHDAILMRVVSPLDGGAKSCIDVYPRVFRNYPGVRFRYRIHEQIWPALAAHSPRVLDSPLRILHHGYNQPTPILDKKRERNLEIALAVLAEEPNNGFYLYHAGFACLTLGRREEAQQWLERALRFSEPGMAQVAILNALGQTHYDDRNMAAATLALKSSTEICPEQFYGWALLADIELQSNRHEQAIVALERCLAVRTSRLNTDITPSRAILAMKLGLSQVLSHRPAEAKKWLEEALATGLPPEHEATARRYLPLAEKLRGA